MAPISCVTIFIQFHLIYLIGQKSLIFEKQNELIVQCTCDCNAHTPLQPDTLRLTILITTLVTMNHAIN